MSARKIKQSSARNVLVFLTSSTDHITGKTGATLTINESLGAGAFGSISPTVTERSFGHYQIALTAFNTTSLGDYGFHATAFGADAIDTYMEIVAYDASDAVRLGLTALPNAAAEASGGLFTRGSGAGQINQQANGQIDANIERVRNSVLNALVSGRMDSSAGALAAGVITATSIAAAAFAAAKFASDYSALVGDAVADEVYDSAAPANARSLRAITNVMISALVAEAADLDSDGAVAFRDTGDTKDRITGSVSGGSRTLTTLDGS